MEWRWNASRIVILEGSYRRDGFVFVDRPFDADEGTRIMTDYFIGREEGGGGVVWGEGWCGCFLSGGLEKDLST